MFGREGVFKDDGLVSFAGFVQGENERHVACSAKGVDEAAAVEVEECCFVVSVLPRGSHGGEEVQNWWWDILQLRI